MASAMEFGVSLPSRGPLARPDIVLKIAAKAEALRYASVFVSDHIVLPTSSARSVYPYSPTGQLPGGANQDYLEPLSQSGDDGEDAGDDRRPLPRSRHPRC